MSSNQDYPYIVMWGEKVMGSSRYYIDEQVRKAREAGAPENAIYQDHDHPEVWHVTDDITNESARASLGLDPLPPTAPAALSSYHGEILSQEPATGLDSFLYRVQFPSIVEAARWSGQYKITARVNLRDPERFRFDQRVVVELQPAE